MELFGVDWLTESWKYIQEDKVERYRMLMALLPLARTPMDKKGARAMQSYSKKLEKNLESFVPWQKASRRKVSLRGRVKPGEVVVLLDGDEPMGDPLFKDAKTTRE